MRLWWLRAPSAAPVLARAWLRSSLRVARGSRPRGMGLVRAGSGINQEDGRRARWGQTWGRSRAARGRACSPGLLLCGARGQRPDVPVAHRVEDVGEQLAGRGDLGDVARLDAAAGDDGGPGLADRGAGRGPLDRLDQRPVQRR